MYNWYGGRFASGKLPAPIMTDWTLDSLQFSYAYPLNHARYLPTINKPRLLHEARAHVCAARKAVAS